METMLNLNLIIGLLSKIEELQLNFYFCTSPALFSKLFHPRQTKYRLQRNKSFSKEFYESAFTSALFYVIGLFAGNLRRINYDRGSRLEITIDRNKPKDSTKRSFEVLENIQGYLEARFISCERDLNPSSGNLLLFVSEKCLKIFGEFPRTGKFKIDLFFNVAKEESMAGEDLHSNQEYLLLSIYAYIQYQSSRALDLIKFSAFKPNEMIFGFQKIVSLDSKSLNGLRNAIEQSCKSCFIDSSSLNLTIRLQPIKKSLLLNLSKLKVNLMRLDQKYGKISEKNNCVFVQYDQERNLDINIRLNSSEQTCYFAVELNIEENLVY
ncbi:MAG: hypothetical protein MHPSP_002599, partial [Paramarteilia canceri]